MTRRLIGLVLLPNVELAGVEVEVGILRIQLVLFDCEVALEWRALGFANWRVCGNTARECCRGGNSCRNLHFDGAEL